MKSNIRIHRNWKPFRVRAVQSLENISMQLFNFPLHLHSHEWRKKRSTFTHSFIHSLISLQLLSCRALQQKHSYTILDNIFIHQPQQQQRQQFSFYIILKLQSISMTARHKKTDKQTDRYKNNKPQTAAQLYLLCICRGKLLWELLWTVAIA